MGWIDFIVPLGLTLLLEGIIALVWGLRQRNLLLFVLVNVLTNPAAVLLHALFPHWIITFLLELMVVLTEGFCYSKWGEEIRRPWVFALTANVFSFCVGLGIGYLI